jgi:pimeloyl-ACP methyl ester carboxylesterase
LKRRPYGRAFSLTARQTDHGPAEAKLDAVDAPTVVIMGERDPDFKDPAAEAEFIGDALKAKVVMVPDAGHYPHAQQPEITSAAVVALLNEVHGA